MTGAAVRVHDLRRHHDGRAVLDGMSFSVPRGSICGMVGPNGAGKSTTLRVLMGLAFAAGSVEVLGQSGRPRPATLERIAFVPETGDFYPFANVGELIRLTRSFYPAWDTALEARLVNAFELRLTQRCKHLSKGLRSRLWLLLALCRRADLLILDEASDGLDPVALDLVQRLLIAQVSERGATILFATHQLADVEQLADRVLMVDSGRCVMDGALDDIRQRYRIVRCALDETATPAPPPLAHWRRDGRFLTGLSGDDPAELAALLPRGVEILDAQPATLKDVFLAQVGRPA